MKVNETHLMLEGWSRIPETNGVVVKRLSRLIDTYKKIPIRFRTTFYDGNETVYVFDGKEIKTR